MDSDTSAKPSAVDSVDGNGAGSSGGDDRSRSGDEYTGSRGYIFVLNYTKARPDDLRRVKALFGNTLSYTLVIKENRCVEEVKSDLVDVRKDLNKGTYDFFILFVLSLGDEDSGLPSGQTGLEEMMGDFIDGSMDNFKGRPRVFIIQACRNQDFQWDSPAEFETLLPKDSDLLFAFSTTPGYIADRSRPTGTKFIQKLLDVLEKNYATKHLEAMLTMVNREAAQSNVGQKNSNQKQIPCSWSTLTKDLYLRPNK